MCKDFEKFEEYDSKKNADTLLISHLIKVFYNLILTSL